MAAKWRRKSMFGGEQTLTLTLKTRSSSLSTGSTTTSALYAANTRDSKLPSLLAPNLQQACHHLAILAGRKVLTESSVSGPGSLGNHLPATLDCLR